MSSSTGINVSYTPKMKTYFDQVDVMHSKLEDTLKAIDKVDMILGVSYDKVMKAKNDLDKIINESLEKIYEAQSNLATATLNFNVDINKMNILQDKYNITAIQLEDYLNDKGNEDYEVLCESDDDTDFESDDADIEDEYELVTVLPRTRMTRKDVLTPDEAVKAKKASKMHKLKPRSVKRDLTKMKENKDNSKRVKKSHDVTLM